MISQSNAKRTSHDYEQTAMSRFSLDSQVSVGNEGSEPPDPRPYSSNELEPIAILPKQFRLVGKALR